MQRVLNLLAPQFVDPLRAACPELEIVDVEEDGPLSDDVHGEILLMYPQAPPNLKEVLGRGVRWVHAYGTGVDGFPFHLLGDRIMTCSRGASAPEISEWVMAVMLAFEKRLPEIFLEEPSEHWYYDSLGTLHQKNLALIGFGAIAQAIARRALPFGMRVSALRRTDAANPIKEVNLVSSIEDLVSDADHVVVAAPSTSATHHLLDDKVLGLMKRGVHIVNIARGEIVDQDALLRVLDSGRVERATLDCVTPEPLPAGHWLYEHPRVRVSAHISWSSDRATEALLETFIENLGRYGRGEELIARVDPIAGY